MKKFFKIGCGGLILLFGFVIAMGLIFGDTSNSDGEKTTSNNKTEAEKEKEKTVGIGDELSVNKVAFVVNGIEEVSEISAANGYMKYTPDSEGAVFLTVNVTVKNNDTQMIQTDSSFFKLKTAEGATYSPSTILVADDKYFVFEGINPGLSLTGNVVFEVPPGLTGLELQVKTGFVGAKSGKIKLN